MLVKIIFKGNPSELELKPTFGTQPKISFSHKDNPFITMDFEYRGKSRIDGENIFKVISENNGYRVTDFTFNGHKIEWVDIVNQDESIVY